MEGKIDYQAFSYFSKEEQGDIVMMVLGFLVKALQINERIHRHVVSSDRSELLKKKQRNWAEGIARIRHFKNFPQIGQILFPFPQSKLKAQLLKKLAKKTTRSYSEKLTQHENQSSAFLAGHVYRYLKENVIRAFWYELRGSDLYMFRTKKATQPKMILALGSGFSIKDKEDLDISPKAGSHSDQPLYSFELVFPSGHKKEFLFFDCFEKRAWFSALYSIVGDFDFKSEYQILTEVEEIQGETSYKGFSKITDESLVFSILAKRSHLPQQQTLLYEQQLSSRLAVLRVCKHPLIPRLVAIHETADHYYVAWEPTEGGDLESYIKRFGITSKIIGHILSQIGEVLNFLSMMNIVVGNLRLSSFSVAEAIAPSDTTTLPKIRLVDLSEATILGPHSYCDLSTSLSLYSAPEILSEPQSLVSVASDAFSLGVIIYQILFKKLPFTTIQQLLEGTFKAPGCKDKISERASILMSSKSVLTIRASEERSTSQAIGQQVQ